MRLADWCDALVIAPATANTIATIANGRADSLIALCSIGLDKPRVVIPNMNSKMWAAPSVQRNLLTLVSDGWKVLGVDGVDKPVVAPTPPSVSPEELVSFIARSIGLDA